MVAVEEEISVALTSLIQKCDQRLNDVKGLPPHSHSFGTRQGTSRFLQAMCTSSPARFSTPTRRTRAPTTSPYGLITSFDTSSQREAVVWLIGRINVILSRGGITSGPFEAHQGPGRKNVPSRSSSNACWSSVWVFITIGPYHATGSCSGFPETRRKRIPSSPA
jgi:hypothetical protein